MLGDLKSDKSSHESVSTREYYHLRVPRQADEAQAVARDDQGDQHLAEDGVRVGHPR